MKKGRTKSFCLLLLDFIPLSPFSAIVEALNAMCLTKTPKTETGNAAKKRGARESEGIGVERIEDAMSNVPVKRGEEGFVVES